MEKNLPRHGGRVLAGVARDVTIPHYADLRALPLMDPTLAARGEALAVYRELLRDGRVRAVLNKRKSKVLRREWVVEPGGGRPIDEEAAQGVREMIARLPFDAICRRLLDAVLFGYAVAEIIWGRDEAGRIAPVDILSRRPERFVFDAAWSPRLLTRGQPIHGEPLPARKFIVHRFEAEDSNPYGLGLGSTLYWHVLFKREGVAFWLHFLEKFTSPTPVARYPQGMPDAEVNKLVQGLRDLVQAGVLAVPLGTELDLLEAKRAGEAGYEAWCRYWDEQTAEVVLGETLSTNIGGEGSRAAAETHAQESEIIADEDADQLSATLNTTLLKWITGLNWPGAMPPALWRPRPKNAQAEEETETMRARRRQEELKAHQLLKRLGFAVRDEQKVLSEVMDAEVTAAPGGAGGGPVNPGAEFAAADGGNDHLAAQLEEMAGPQVDAWLDAVRARLEKHLNAGGGWEGAANAALSAFAGMRADPLGRIMGDALALAELDGRSGIVEQTGVNPWSKTKGSKKKP
jgi:phage gp29-like protein